MFSFYAIEVGDEHGDGREPVPAGHDRIVLCGMKMRSPGPTRLVSDLDAVPWSWGQSFLQCDLLSDRRAVVSFEFDYCGRRMSAAIVVVDQRGASAAFATCSSLSARMTVHGNHTASRIHWNKPNHGWSGAPGGRTRLPPTRNRTSMAMPLASA